MFKITKNMKKSAFANKRKPTWETMTYNLWYCPTESAIAALSSVNGLKAIPHNMGGSLTDDFQPSAVCKYLGLPPMK